MADQNRNDDRPMEPVAGQTRPKRKKPIKIAGQLYVPGSGTISRKTFDALPSDATRSICEAAQIDSGRLAALATVLDEAAACWMLADREAPTSVNPRTRSVITAMLKVTRALQQLEEDDFSELKWLAPWLRVEDRASAKTLEDALRARRSKRGPPSDELQATTDAMAALLNAWAEYTNTEATVGFKAKGSAYQTFKELARYLSISQPRTMFHQPEDFSEANLNEFREMLLDQDVYVRAVERRQHEKPGSFGVKTPGRH